MLAALLLTACSNPFANDEEATNQTTSADDDADAEAQADDQAEEGDGASEAESQTEDAVAAPPRIEDPSIQLVSWCVACTEDDIEAGTATPDLVGVTVSGTVNAPPEIGDLNLLIAPLDGEGWTFPIEIGAANFFNMTATIAIDGERVQTSSELRVLILELALDATGGAEVVYQLAPPADDQPTAAPSTAAPAPPADGLPAPDPVEVEEPPPDSGDDGGGPPAAPLPADCVSVANPDPVAVPEVDDDLLHEAGTVVVSDEVVGVFPGC